MNEELECFNDCKESIEQAMLDIKINMPELWVHLKDSIKIDENNKTFSYRPDESIGLDDE